MRTSNLVPEVYYKESRDFSFAGRIFECLLNYAKTGADLVGSSLRSENMKPMVLDLLTSTLGFESKHRYVTKDLVYLAGAFSELLRKKGTLDSVEQAATILLTSQGLSADISVSIDLIDPHIINVVLPPDMTDTILFEDILDYILPAGMVANITYATISKDAAATNVGYGHDLIGVDSEDRSTGLIYSGVFRPSGNTTSIYDDNYITLVEGRSYPYYYYKLNSLNEETPLIYATTYTNLGITEDEWKETCRSYYIVTAFDSPGSTDFNNVITFTQVKSPTPFVTGYYCQLNCSLVVDNGESVGEGSSAVFVKNYLKQGLYEYITVNTSDGNYKFINNTYYTVTEESEISEKPVDWDVDYMSYYIRTGSVGSYNYTQNVNPNFSGNYYKIKIKIIVDTDDNAGVELNCYLGSNVYTKLYTPESEPDNKRSLTYLGVVVSE